jgi:shikimate 5-dehydrogenase
MKVKTAVCYGYGGIASVVTISLQSFRIEVYFTGRKNETAQLRSQDLKVQFWQGEKVDLFINATPASTYSLKLAPNFLEALEHCKGVFNHEMPGIYLSEYCNKNNLYLIKGLKMYYRKTYKQWALLLKGIVDMEKILKLMAQANSP